MLQRSMYTTLLLTQVLSFIEKSVEKQQMKCHRCYILLAEEYLPFCMILCTWDAYVGISFESVNYWTYLSAGSCVAGDSDRVRWRPLHGIQPRIMASPKLKTPSPVQEAKSRSIYWLFCELMNLFISNKHFLLQVDIFFPCSLIRFATLLPSFLFTLTCKSEY